jgi:hypothetical protein
MASNSKKNSVDEVVLNGVLTVVKSNPTRVWSGRMTELGEALVKVVSKKHSAVLPGSPSALRVVLNRVVNRLRSRSVGVRFVRTTDHTRNRMVRFTR